MGLLAQRKINKTVQNKIDWNNKYDLQIDKL